MLDTIKKMQLATVGKKFDILQIGYEGDELKIKKVSTGRKGITYFIVFFLSLGAITYYSDSLYVPIISAVILLSSALFIFYRYEVCLSLITKKITIRKYFSIFTMNISLDLDKIMDFKVREGETGYNVLATIGIADNPLTRLKYEKNLCRFDDYEKAADLALYLKEIYLKKPN